MSFINDFLLVELMIDWIEALMYLTIHVLIFIPYLIGVIIIIRGLTAVLLCAWNIQILDKETQSKYIQICLLKHEPREEKAIESKHFDKNPLILTEEWWRRSIKTSYNPHQRMNPLQSYSSCSLQYGAIGTNYHFIPKNRSLDRSDHYNFNLMRYSETPIRLYKTPGPTTFKFVDPLEYR